jgi:nickel/cobalt exporter
MKKIILISFFLFGISGLTLTASAHDLIPNSVLQYLVNNPQATPQEIESFVDTNNPGLRQSFKSDQDMINILNQAGSTYASNQGSVFSAELKKIVRNQSSSIWFLLVSLLLAIALGALHALTPGHGKTMVAAYLVGSKGRPIDAIILGLVVTATHTSSVIGLGLISLYFSQYILPQTIYPYLTLVSGLLIVGMGLNLLEKRIRNSIKMSRANNGSASAVGEQKPKGSIKSLIGQKALPPTKGIVNKVKMWVSRRGSQVSMSNLISLGISGGIVPCPDALIVLLIAISLNRIGFGLIIVLAFSVGLAGVLIAIGLLIVLARPFMDRHINSNSKILKVLPVLSAIAVVIIGSVFVSQAYFLLRG